MTLQLGGDGAITGCTSLENPDLIASGLTTSGSVDAEKVLVASGTAAAPSWRDLHRANLAGFAQGLTS